MNCTLGRKTNYVVEPIWSATFWNVVFAFWPIAVIAAKHTITMRANITAYSTAVGPSSETRKRRTLFAKVCMYSSSCVTHADVDDDETKERTCVGAAECIANTTGGKPARDWWSTQTHSPRPRLARFRCSSTALESLRNTAYEQPFGSQAVVLDEPRRSLALRHGLAAALPLSRM